MAYTKTIQDADQYFNNQTIKGDTWESFTQADRNLALVQARRELELFLNADAEDPATTSRYRWDYAIFEHAYQILVFQPRTTQPGKNKTIDPRSRSGRNEKNDDSFIDVSIIAQKYLGMNRIRMVRG